MAISTVTATISAMPAERRKATKMRGSAAGMMIFADPLRRRQPQRARDFHQPRLDAAHRGARQDQDRPDAGERDDDDFHAIAEAERDQRDRQQRDRGDRPDRLDRSLPSAGRASRKMPRHDADQQADRAADGEPANAENSVSRVVRRIEPSATASPNAMTIALGGARLSLCGEVASGRRFRRSTISATGSARPFHVADEITPSAARPP